MHGPVLVAEAFAAGTEVEAVYAEAAGMTAAVTETARASGVPVHEVADGGLRKVLDVVEPQDLVAVARHRPAALDDLVSATALGAGPLVVLVAVGDPGNAGTVIRSAEAAGCAGVVLTEGSVDPYNPKAVRATAGSIFRMPVSEGVPFPTIVDACQRAGVATWAMVGEDGTVLDDVDLTGPVALVVGNEAHGLTEPHAGACSARLSIPMSGSVESLNAAVSAAVVMFEAARQRRSGAEPTSRPDRPVGHNEHRSHDPDPAAGSGRTESNGPPPPSPPPTLPTGAHE